MASPMDAVQAVSSAPQPMPDALLALGEELMRQSLLLELASGGGEEVPPPAWRPVRAPPSFFHEPRPQPPPPPPRSVVGTSAMPLPALSSVFSFLGAGCETPLLTGSLALVCRRWYRATFPLFSSVSLFPFLARVPADSASAELLWKRLAQYFDKHTRGQFVTSFSVVDPAFRRAFIASGVELPPVPLWSVIKVIQQLPSLTSVDLRALVAVEVDPGDPLLHVLSRCAPSLHTLRLHPSLLSRGRDPVLWCEVLLRLPALTTLAVGQSPAPPVAPVE
eukprot:RCo013573